MKKNYEKWDSKSEIIWKNTINIIDLYSFALAPADLTKFYDDLVKPIKDTADTIAQHNFEDENGVLIEFDNNSMQTTYTKAATQKYIKVNTDSILINKTNISKNDARLTVIETNGIGNWLGTYKGANGDNFEVLPTPANDLDRVMLEYVVVDDIKYQEYKWEAGKWGKIGVELDSHIHSQGPGITLQDVSNQQDPKINDAKTESIKHTDDKFAIYEEKEITITPAVYDWKTTTDFWTNNDKFKKYKSSKIRVVISQNAGEMDVIMNSNCYSSIGDTLLFSSATNYNQDNVPNFMLEEKLTNKLYFWATKDTPRNEMDVDNIKVRIQIWDIITPAVKAIVLVKK